MSKSEEVKQKFGEWIFPFQLIPVDNPNKTRDEVVQNLQLSRPPIVFYFFKLNTPEILIRVFFI